VAPVVVKKVPAAQALQADAPLLVKKVPAPQLMHVADVVAATEVEKKPEGQERQVEIRLAPGVVE